MAIHFTFVSDVSAGVDSMCSWASLWPFILFLLFWPAYLKLGYSISTLISMDL